jgi:hypothetical protein
MVTFPNPMPKLIASRGFHMHLATMLPQCIPVDIVQSFPELPIHPDVHMASRGVDNQTATAE